MSELHIIVTEANSVGAIGVIRSLGRAGCKVHALSFHKDALGFESNYASTTVVSPAYDSPNFVDWFREYVSANQIHGIVPSEGLLLALKNNLDEFAAKLMFSTGLDKVYHCFSKYDVLSKLSGGDCPGPASDNLPQTIFYEAGQKIPSELELEKLNPPYFIKADSVHAFDEQDSLVEKMDSPKEVQRRLSELSGTYGKMIVQGFVKGVDAGVYFLIWGGKVVAEFMNRSLHSVPHTGGFYSFRESFAHKKLRDDALAKLDRIGWQGVAMMEYRWDPESDRFYFIELNARFWGSLHHALFAGVDFPLLLLKAFQGEQIPVSTTYPLGLRCRYTFPLEVQYVGSRVKDPRLTLKEKLLTMLEFFALFGDFTSYSDLWFPKDRKLYFISMFRLIRSLVR